MQITLKSLTDPERLIRAVKALKDASRSNDRPSGMSLREAKAAVDSIRGYTYSDDLSGGLRPRATAPVVPVTVEVTDPSHLDGIIEWEAVREDTDSVPRQVVLEFVLDVLSTADQDGARFLRDLESYKRLRESL